MSVELGDDLSPAEMLVGVDLAALLPLVDGVESISYRAGEVIYAEGDEGGLIYLVYEGKVRVGCTAADGRQCTFSVLGASEIFGEESVLDTGPRRACATALTDMRGISVTENAVVSLMMTNPDVADRFLRLVARRIRSATASMTEAASSDVAARVARQLLDLTQRFGVQEDGAIRVPMELTQEQFAHLVGTSRESVSKVLREFREQGWVRAERGSILIRDSTTLNCLMRGRRPDTAYDQSTRGAARADRSDLRR